jgi:pseudaminic acid cytidylyltransferase
MTEHSKIAVIPARGGSKRIPRKNVKDFCGKPMIAWSILAALESKLFDEIVVSTDDDEIAQVAEHYGAAVPFRRPADLSDDHTPTIPVIAHAIRWWEANRVPIECACCIYATAPFLRASDLHRGYEMLRKDAEADFAFSITTYAFPIFRSLKIDRNGRVQMFWPENELVRSQDLPEAWHDAGQFYWGRKQAFLDHNGIYSARSLGVSIARERVQDIDSLEDWRHAELMFELIAGERDASTAPNHSS